MLTIMAIAVVNVLAAGCGSSEEEADGPTGPTVATTELGGTYQLTQLQVDGDEVAIDAIEVGDGLDVTIDAAFGGLRLDTACGVLLGSFSLAEDGRAGVTIAGGSTIDCSAAARGQQDELVSALGRIDAWSAEGDATPLVSGIDLASSADDLIILRRR